MLTRIRHALRRHHKTDPEQSYLEEATSMADLEMRHREIARGRFANRSGFRT